MDRHNRERKQRPQLGIFKDVQIEENRYVDVLKEIGGKHLTGDGEQVSMIQLPRRAVHSVTSGVFGAPPTFAHLPTFGYYRKTIRLI
jgi:hypothetical protein